MNLFLNTFKNKHGVFSTTMISFSNDSLKLQELDHLSCFQKIQEFKQLTTQTLNGRTAYIANPTNEELEFFINNKGFNETIFYHK